jgi:integrase
MSINPARETKLPAPGDPRARSLSLEEAKAFASVKNDFWFGDAFVFQLLTGLRQQELMALIWEDVDFAQGTLRVERACIWINGVCIYLGCTKSIRSHRVIDLAPSSLDLLRHHFEEQQKVIEARTREGRPYGEPKIREWVTRECPAKALPYASAKLIFPTRAGRVPRSTEPREQFKAMLRRAGIEKNYRQYDLSCAHASFLLIDGVPPHVVARRMGRSVATLMSTYAHVLRGRISCLADTFAE